MNTFYFVILFIVYPLAFLLLYKSLTKIIAYMEYLESCLSVLEKDGGYNEGN